MRWLAVEERGYARYTPEYARAVRANGSMRERVVMRARAAGGSGRRALANRALRILRAVDNDARCAVSATRVE